MDYTINIADVSILLFCIGIFLYMESLERKILVKKAMPKSVFAIYMALSFVWFLIVTVLVICNHVLK